MKKKNRNGANKTFIKRVYNVVIPCKYLFSIIKGYDNDIKRTEDLKEDIYSGDVLPL
jgi:hypothetical protein